MHKHYKDYYWKNGKPYGKESVLPQSDVYEISYRIISDPYHARYSIEEYQNQNFKRLVYDSAIFDFRHLRRPEQATWQKEHLDERSTLIRNHDDRIILKEQYHFEGQLCRSCQLASPHGIFLSIHRLYYKVLGDPFDGVILYDMNDKPILKKTYTFDTDSQSFTDLLSESWVMEI